MKITLHELRKVIRGIIAEQTTLKEMSASWTGDAGWRVKPDIFIDGKYIDGNPDAIADLPPLVQRTAKLFASLDPSGTFMNRFSIRSLSRDRWKVERFGEHEGHQRTRGQVSGYGSSVGGDYTMVDFNPDVDTEINIRWRISADIDSNGKISVSAESGPDSGADGPKEIDLGTGSRLNVSAIKAWASANLKDSGWGRGGVWQIEPFSTKPADGYTSAV